MAEGLDLTNLAPGDAVAALRSFPRRYRALFAFEDGDDADALVNRAGPDGRTAVDVVDGVARAVAVLGHALDQVLTQDSAVLHTGVFDPEARQFVDGPAAPSLEDALDHLALEADALADRIERTGPAEWSRSATVADGSGRDGSALDVVREAVRTGADGLREVEAALKHARA